MAHQEASCEVRSVDDKVSNTIRVECVGSAFRLYANGSLLIELQDNTFVGGDVGLIAGTFDVPGTIIAFDDFVVYAAE